MQWLANMDAITNTALPRGSPPLTNNRVSNSNCKIFWALNWRDLGIYSKQDVLFAAMNCITFGWKVLKKSPVTCITKAELEVLVALQWPLPHWVTLSSPCQACYRSTVEKIKTRSSLHSLALQRSQAFAVNWNNMKIWPFILERGDWMLASIFV